MESVRIEKTAKSPSFIMTEGYIRLSGRSIPQNSRQAYKMCFDWLEQYVKDPKKETKIDLFFEYIDTSSIRCVIDILTTISSIRDDYHHVEVNWYYEEDDEDSHDLGVYVQTHLKIPLNVIPVEEGGDIPLLI